MSDKVFFARSNSSLVAVIPGIAFEFGDQQYTHNNCTLLTYMEGTLKKGADQGQIKEVLGYWGDIVCSPYVSFGIDSADTSKHPSSGVISSSSANISSTNNNNDPTANNSKLLKEDKGFTIKTSSRVYVFQAESCSEAASWVITLRKFITAKHIK